MRTTSSVKWFIKLLIYLLKSLQIFLIFPEIFVVTFMNMFEQHLSTTLTISVHHSIKLYAQNVIITTYRKHQHLCLIITMLQLDMGGKNPHC